MKKYVVLRVLCVTCILTMVASNVTVFAGNGVKVVNWTSIKSDYAVAGNDVRLNKTTPPGTYTGLGYCRAQVGDTSLTDGGILWVIVEGSGDDRTYETREYSVKVYGTSKAKYASAWGYL